MDDATPLDPRARKFRQAAFVYLHLGLLYLFAVWAIHSAGLLLVDRGPTWVWMLMGVAILGAVFWGLWSWRHPWFARIVWAVHSLRLPALIENAYFPSPDAAIPPSFYLTAIGIVLVNLWMLARAGWDL